MQNLLFEVSHETQIFVEDECTTKGHTMKDFFEILIETYKNRDQKVSKTQKDELNLEPTEEMDITTTKEEKETPLKKKSKGSKD